MSAPNSSKVTVEEILRDPDHRACRAVTVCGTLQVSATEARLVSGADSISVETENGSIARELIRRGIAPYVGGPLLYDHEAVISAVVSRGKDGSLSLREVRAITLNPGQANEEKVVSFL